MNNIISVGSHCFGCTACIQICPISCISIFPDDKGFLYPSVDEKSCTECGLCRDVCPYLTGCRGAELFPDTQVYAVKHKDDSVRSNSSSGGAFTALSDYILKRGGVVYGAAFDDHMKVRHQRADSPAGRDRFRGSKYVQSDLGDSFISAKADLEQGYPVLFTGTPCQTAGLRNYLQKDYDNLFLVDIVCHGVPSPRIFQDYLASIQKKRGKVITDCNFRCKIYGWRMLTLLIKQDNDETYIQSSESIYYSWFLTNYTLRLSCYECRFTNFNRPGDISLADFWGIEKTIPSFSDDVGISLMLLNSNKGLQLFSSIAAEVEYLKSTHDDCLQGSLHTPAKINSRRDDFWMDYCTKGYAYVARKYTGLKVSERIKQKIKHVMRHTPLFKIYHAMRKR